MKRRTFFKRLVQGFGVLTAGVLGVPAVATVLSPLFKGRGARWQVVGEMNTFPVGQVTRALVDIPRDDWAEKLRVQGVYVWRPAKGEVVVFSRACTDLACPVTWDSGSGWFFCPCHGGIFSQEGKRMAGPPKRDLFRYAYRVRDGVLEIDLNSLPPMA